MRSTVAVIGTIFIDCKGFARQQYNPLGRNLGEIRFVHGGVGRNVAENLANMKLPTRFVASVDKSGIGDEVRERLVMVGMDLEYLAVAERQGMGMWLAVMNEHGDLAGSISQMPDLAVLEKLLNEKGEECISQSGHVVLELDLNAAITRKVIALAHRNAIPVYGIPGNLSVILSNRDILPQLDCFICNDIEAGRLFNKDFGAMTIEHKLRELKEFVADSGMKSMVITLGSQGAVYCDARSGESGYQPVFPVELVDSSGAGDAFFSGTVLGLATGHSLAQSVLFGTKVAGWTIQSSENTCPTLYEKLINDELIAPLYNT